MKRKRFTFLVLLATYFCFGLPLWAQDVNEAFSFAQSLKRDRLYEAASQQFLRFAMEHPQNELAPRALENAVQCFVEMDSLVNASKVLRTLLDNYPDDPRRCRNKILLGKLLHKTGRFGEAEGVFADVIANEKDCSFLPEAMLGRSEALIALSRYKEAGSVLRDLLKNYDNDKISPRAMFNLATASLNGGDKEEALRAFAMLGSKYPRHPLSAFALLQSARIQVEKGDTMGALAMYEKAKEFKENTIFVPACMEGAENLEKMGRYRDALAWYEELIARKDLKEAPSLFADAVRVAFKSGDYEKAASLAVEYERHADWGFSDEIGLYQARAYLAIGKNEEALGKARELSKKAPDGESSVYAPRIAAEALLNLGRPREAVRELRWYVSSAADSAGRVEGLEKLADVYMTALEDTSTALEILQEKLDVEKKRNPGEFLDVARAFEKAGKYKQARNMYGEIALTFPLMQEGEKALGRIKFLDAFIVLDPKDSLKKMEKIASKIVSLPKFEGMLMLAESRIEVMKDFEGALELVGEVLRDARDRDVKARALYLKGACLALSARKAMALGDSLEARKAIGEGMGAWKSLLEGQRGSSWAARAAYEELFLKAEIEGDVDTASVFRVLSAYPGRGERAKAFELLGDHYAGLGGLGALKAEIGYYRKALLTPDALDDAPGVRLKLAEALFKAGDYEESLVLARSVLEDERKSIRLRAEYRAALALRELKKYRDAIPFFSDVAQADLYGKTGAKALLHSADCYYMLGDFRSAVKFYTRALDRAPDDHFTWEIMYRLSLAWDKLGESGDALEFMEACLSSGLGGKMRPRAYEHALRMARSLGDDAKTASILERFFKEYRRGSGYLDKGRELIEWYFGQRLYGKALELADLLMQGCSKSEAPRAKAIKSMALYRAGRITEARTLEEELKSLPQSGDLVWDVELAASWYYYESKEYALALSRVRPLVERCPNDSRCEEAMFLETMSLFSQNKVEQAGKSADRFFSRYSLSKYAPVVHLRFGNALAVRGQYREASIHFGEAHAGSKDSSIVFEALKNQAISYQKISKWREAARVWEKLLEKFPSTSYSLEASLNVARCKMEGGDLKGAVKAYKKIIPKLDDQGKARAYYWTGECYQKMGDFGEAIVEYLKVPYLVPREAQWGVTAKLKAAECYASLGKVESAKKLYNSVIGQYGQASNWGKFASERLKELENPSGDDKKQK